jgi:hypothetical protein
MKNNTLTIKQIISELSEFKNREMIQYKQKLDSDFLLYSIMYIEDYTNCLHYIKYCNRLLSYNDSEIIKALSELLRDYRFSNGSGRFNDIHQLSEFKTIRDLGNDLVHRIENN